MNYTVILLTHGDDRSFMERTIRSAMESLRPSPAKCVIVDDKESRGFCVATGAAWQAGVESATEYVFHLEHDFRFLQPVNVEHLAKILAVDGSLAQISLMRQPVSPPEIAAGGVCQSFPVGTFERSEFLDGVAHLPFGANRWPFLLHDAYFTTNPSLMRRDFMERNPWPSHYERQCEGLFSMDLRARGYRFAVWGQGEPWVEHFGERTGHGY